MPISKIIHKTLYTFKEMLDREGDGEISSAAVEKARQWLQDAAVGDNYWYEFEIDTWKEALESIGLTNPNISFSGFSSQGDGASFTSGVNVKTLLKFITTSIQPDNSINPIPNTSPVQEDFRPWLLYQMGKRTDEPHCGITEVTKLRRLLRCTDYLSGAVTRQSHHYAHEATCKLELDFHTSGSYRRSEKLVNALETSLEELRLDLCGALYHSLQREYYYRISDAALIEDAESNSYTFDSKGNRE